MRIQQGLDRVLKTMIPYHTSFLINGGLYAPLKIAIFNIVQERRKVSPNSIVRLFYLIDIVKFGQMVVFYKIFHPH